MSENFKEQLGKEFYTEKIKRGRIIEPNLQNNLMKLLNIYRLATRGLAKRLIKTLVENFQFLLNFVRKVSIS